MNIKWEKNEHSVTGNLLLKAKDFYISYASAVSLSVMGEIMGSDGGGAETALYKDGDFYILNGDFRKEYEKLVPLGFDECLKFHNEQKKFNKSSWSD